MKKFTDFKAAPAAQREALPAGGYVAKILDAKEMNYDWGDVLAISFDIIEGDRKDHFKNDYNAQTQEDKRWKGTYRLNLPKDDGSEKDGWSKRTFGNAIWAIEESNPSFNWNWDEKSLVGKGVGVLFRNKEWGFDGKTGWTTECCAFTSIDNIRNAKFKFPKDKPLNNGSGSGFAPLSGGDSDLPF